ncbi:alpha-N-acetylglucosaminidase [Galbibacter sp. BG1]|uniref:alpha-N-acetylglucosaminidase n=1 Tax=Galbibacter sp. BG1 TaxID=1170699 RepID=UPI0015BD9BEB|nr:alpha-N-acetylglucosaminidase [Galbibacter sp. BG1]QLE01815.1 alpha-N-acetylglucosaminidase [Galbibacter sp. BG1]
MKYSKLVPLVLLFFILCSYSCKNDGEKDLDAIHLLIKRTLPEHAENFILEELKSDTTGSAFEISSLDGCVHIRATDKSAFSKAFYHYMRHFMKGNVSRLGTQIPKYDSLPEIAEPVYKKSNATYRYYLNYVAFNYSYLFYSWEEWERELDWMAFQGINLALAPIGMEAVWQNTLKKIDFNDKEIKEFLPGPAYTSWWLMDNLEGWGGPVSQNWIDEQVELQKKILERMDELGIEPVLPAFYGMVPNSLREKYPNNQIYKDTLWGGFQRPAFLDPNDSLFTSMAKVFYDEQEKLFGKASFFSGDPFHEGGKKMGDPTQAAMGIQSAMREHSEDAIWLLTGWQENPTDELLTGTDADATLVLNLSGEGVPAYATRNIFGKRDFLWCNVNNFGNNTYMYANIDSITQVPLKLTKPPYEKYYKGIGMAMEGVFTDPLVYELFFDMAWEDDSFNKDNWLADYATYRYGRYNKNAEEAIQNLAESVYNIPFRTENIMCARPSLAVKQTTTWAPDYNLMPYSQETLKKSFENLMSVSDDYIIQTETYKVDLVNIGRQLLTASAYEKHQQIKDAFERKENEAFKEHANDFLNMIAFTDSLVSVLPHFSLYDWQQKAFESGHSKKESELFLWNANRLITLWADEPGSADLHDYAYREWHGLLSSFYYKRWKMYFDYLESVLEGNNPQPPDFYTFEDQWGYTQQKDPNLNIQDFKKMAKRVNSFVETNP